MDWPRPKLLETLREKSSWRPDLAAGLSVGVVALPLAIGFGIASGVTPSQGLWTAIIGGLLVAFLGGSRVQIAGPTGAFVPIVAGIIATHGYAGLAMATLMAGVFLLLMGALKLGNLIKFIPFPVISGFTSGIAVVIFVGQLKEFLGLKMPMPAHTIEQIGVLFGHLAEAHWQPITVGFLALAILIFWPKRLRAVPASVAAVIITALLVFLLRIPVETIGSKFGELPKGFPQLTLPACGLGQIRDLMIPALTIAMLGAIESLLSAMVADGMLEDRHDSNQELIAQGLANFAAPFFCGIPITGAIARTAANVRAGGRTPVSGIVHSLVLLVFALVAAPLAKFIPLTTLSAILIVVVYRMGEWDNFLELAHSTKSDFIVLLLTFFLTVAFDLTVAVGVGLSLAGVLFVRRMEEITHVRLVTPETELELGSDSVREKHLPEGVLVFRIEGPFFFGVAEKLESALARAGSIPRVVIFRVRKVPAIDASGLRALQVAFEKFHRKGTRLVLSGVQAQPMKVLFRSGFVDRIGLDNICPNIDIALQRAQALLEGDVPSRKTALGTSHLQRL